VRKEIDPKQFGLPGRTLIEKLDKNHYALVIDRKSRIIMADGRKIVEKAAKIRKVVPEAKISLKSSAPVCSKTIPYLAGQGIDLIK